MNYEDEVYIEPAIKIEARIKFLLRDQSEVSGIWLRRYFYASEIPRTGDRLLICDLSNGVSLESPVKQTMFNMNFIGSIVILREIGETVRFSKEVFDQFIEQGWELKEWDLKR